MTKFAKAKDLGSLVRSKRKKKDLSQQQLAEICGVGRRFISELEAGKKESYDLGLTLRVLQRLGFEVRIFDKEENEFV